jgi:hypothetical protein
MRRSMEAWCVPRRDGRRTREIPDRGAGTMARMAREASPHGDKAASRASDAFARRRHPPTRLLRGLGGNHSCHRP